MCQLLNANVLYKDTEPISLVTLGGDQNWSRPVQNYPQGSKNLYPYEA